MIRKTLLMIVALAGLTATSASAQDDKSVGLGFIVGEPTGLDLKMFLNNENALEFGLAWSLDDNDHLHIQGDYLWHRYGLIELDTADEMPLHFGIGARMVIRDEPADDIFGIRFPVGLSYIFANYPFDIFVTIVPILDLAPDSDFDLEGAIGARFWF